MGALLAANRHDRIVHAVTLRAECGTLTAFTGDHDGVVRAWDAFTGRQLDCRFPRVSRLVSVLEYGSLHGHSVLVIGGSDGIIRVWSPATEQIVARAQLTVRAQDVIMRPDGDLYIATAMGVVTLNVGDWT